MTARGGGGVLSNCMVEAKVGIESGCGRRRGGQGRSCCGVGRNWSLLLRGVRTCCF